MAIDEMTLTKGQVRKLNALRKSVGDALGEEVFGKWLAKQTEASAARRADPVAEKIAEALAAFEDDPKFRLRPLRLHDPPRPRQGGIGIGGGEERASVSGTDAERCREPATE